MAVAVESRLEYFFRLGLRNSSTIEISAGITVFDGAPPSAEIKLPDTVSRSLIPLRRVQHEWEVQARPCRNGDDGDAQGTSVPQYELEVTHPPYLVQGRNVTVSVSLKSLNRSSGRLPPSKIVIKAYTLPTFSWTASLVSSPQAKQRVLSLQDRGGLGDEHRSMRQRRAKTVLAQDSDQGTMGCQADPFWEAMIGGVPRSAAHIDARNGSVFDHFFDLALIGIISDGVRRGWRTAVDSWVSISSGRPFKPDHKLSASQVQSQACWPPCQVLRGLSCAMVSSSSLYFGATMVSLGGHRHRLFWLWMGIQASICC